MWKYVRSAEDDYILVHDPHSFPQLVGEANFTLDDFKAVRVSDGGAVTQGRASALIESEAVMSLQEGLPAQFFDHKQGTFVERVVKTDNQLMLLLLIPIDNLASAQKKAHVNKAPERETVTVIQLKLIESVFAQDNAVNICKHLGVWIPKMSLSTTVVVKTRTKEVRNQEILSQFYILVSAPRTMLGYCIDVSRFRGDSNDLLEKRPRDLHVDRPSIPPVSGPHLFSQELPPLPQKSPRDVTRCLVGFRLKDPSAVLNTIPKVLEVMLETASLDRRFPSFQKVLGHAFVGMQGCDELVQLTIPASLTARRVFWEVQRIERSVGGSFPVIDEKRLELALLDITALRAWAMQIANKDHFRLGLNAFLDDDTLLDVMIAQDHAFEDAREVVRLHRNAALAAGKRSSVAVTLPGALAQPSSSHIWEASQYSANSALDFMFLLEQEYADCARHAFDEDAIDKLPEFCTIKDMTVQVSGISRIAPAAETLREAATVAPSLLPPQSSLGETFNLDSSPSARSALDSARDQVRAQQLCTVCETGADLRRGLARFVGGRL